MRPDAGLMQIEWGGGEVLKLAEVGTAAEEAPTRVWERGWVVENGVTEGAK